MTFSPQCQSLGVARPPGPKLDPLAPVPMLTTHAMVAEKPTEKKEMHPGTQGMGGGMGGMM